MPVERIFKMQPGRQSAAACCVDRRHFLGAGTMGLGSLALATLLKGEGLRAGQPEQPPLAPPKYDLHPKSPASTPRATAMISLFMGGGPSHLDLFDPKPMLQKHHGEEMPVGEIRFDNPGGASKILMGSPFSFRPHGESGIEISELLPHTATIVDDITLIRSMNLNGIRNHEGGMRALTMGRNNIGRASLGSWLTYGLGSETQNLPAYVALVMRQRPPGPPLVTSGFLPSIFQGTVVRQEEPRIMNLEPPQHLRGARQERQLSLLKQLNVDHLREFPGEHDLEARIASYELAARMQTAALEALDIRHETQALQEMYGIDREPTRQLGEACLLARRLVERGVRFVQIWYYNWDMHADIEKRLRKACEESDLPAAALVRDLKQRGLLDTTLVHWGGEMGRLPVVQNTGGGMETAGRDHNSDAFSMWLAGGGVKAGHVHGATDDFGLQVAESKVCHFDYHATLLHLFGLDANHLVFKRNGREENLLDGQPGQIAREILA